MTSIPSSLELERQLQRRMLWLMASLFIALLLFYAGFGWRAGASRFAWLAGSTAVFSIGATVLAARAGRPRLGIEIINAVAFACLIYSVFHQQGLYSPALWWLCLPPVFLLLAGSTRLGLLLGAVLLGVIALLTHIGPRSIEQAIMLLPDPHVQMGLAEFLSTVALLLVAGICVHWRLELQKALEMAREAAASATEAKARFLAKMSHEIRTPLNGMIAATELIRSGRATEEQKRQLLSVQEQSANVLLSLVNDILDLSKIEARKLDIVDAPLRLRSLVFGVNELYAVQAFNKGLELSCSCDPQVPVSVLGDAMRVRQILCNLVANAVKFTPRGGVHLHVECTPGFIGFSVNDSGPGIPPAVLNRLFRAFEQADATVTREHGGSGLGLAICDELAQLMGGRIAVTSEPGAGSVFTLFVPLKPDPNSTPRRPPARDGRRAIVACATDGLTRHMSGVLDDLGIEALPAPQVPGRDDVIAAHAGFVFIDAGLLAGHDARNLLHDLEGSGARIVLLAPLGADTMIAAMPSGMPLLYKPVRRSTVQAALRAEPSSPSGPQRVTPQDAAVAPLRTARSWRVLVVDDNPVNQIVIQAMLAELGCQCEQASDGAAGVAKYRNGHFDVVLMDLEMPGMNGLAASAALREHEAAAGRARGRVVAITGASAAERWSDCQNAGMDDYVNKPFQLQDLQLALDRVQTS